MEELSEIKIKKEDCEIHYLSVENVKEITSKTKIVNQNKEIRVINWIEVQSKIKREEFVDPNDPIYDDLKSNKRKYDSDDEEETSENYEEEEEPAPKRVCLENEIYLDCEWVGCRYNTMDYAVFQEHVKTHLPDLVVKSYKNGSSNYVCLWDLCEFETPNEKMIKSHVNYHTYHTRIKALGKIVLHNDGKCYKDSSRRNRIPALPEEFTCLWRGCTHKFVAVQDFFDHVRSHANGEKKGRGEYMHCKWMGCLMKRNTNTTYLRHVLTHTLYRRIACPNCGVTYNDKPSMIVHCERQKKKLEFKCELCPRYFSTQRLLRKHCYDHKKDFKCSDCNVTFTRKCSLVSHIRQIHLNVKNLQCNLCEYRCTNKNDMRDHLDRHEKKGRKWLGGMEDRQYACHYCEKSWTRANKLTQHLIKFHNYKPVTRSNKFRYVLTDEGVYRLSDSIERPLLESKRLTEISLKGVIKQGEAVGDKREFKLIESLKSEPKFALVKSSEEEESIRKLFAEQEYDKPVTRSMKVAKKKYFKCRKCKKYVPKDNTHKCEQDALVSTHTMKNVIEYDKVFDLKHESASHIEISIEDVDLQGNVVKIEVVESEEVLVG